MLLNYCGILEGITGGRVWLNAGVPFTAACPSYRLANSQTLLCRRCTTRLPPRSRGCHLTNCDDLPARSTNPAVPLHPDTIDHRRTPAERNLRLAACR